MQMQSTPVAAFESEEIDDANFVVVDTQTENYNKANRMTEDDDMGDGEAVIFEEAATAYNPSKGFDEDDCDENNQEILLGDSNISKKERLGLKFGSGSINSSKMSNKNSLNISGRP